MSHFEDKEISGVLAKLTKVADDRGGDVSLSAEEVQAILTPEEFQLFRKMQEDAQIYRERVGEGLAKEAEASQFLGKCVDAICKETSFNNTILMFGATFYYAYWKLVNDIRAKRNR